MSPRVCVKWRNSYQPVYPNFGSQFAIGIFPFHRKGGGFYPRFLTRQSIQDLRFVAFALCPAKVHPQKHFSPILGLGPTSPSMYLHNRIADVFRPGENPLDFQPANMLFNGVQFLLDFPDDRLILLLQSKLEQNRSLVQFLVETEEVLNQSRNLLLFLE